MTEPRRLHSAPPREASPQEVAAEQAAECLIDRQKQYNNDHGLPWKDLHDLVGPLLPGEMWIFGARPGDGKTTLLLNLLTARVNAFQPTLYFGMERPASELRALWAAWQLGLDWDAVLENAWDRLPAGAHADFEEMVRLQAGPVLSKLALFSGAHRPTPSAVLKALDHGEQYGVTTLILDHIHRLRYDRDDERRSISEAVRQLKEQASRRGLTVLLAAQLNRPQDRSPIAALIPPALAALKETGTLEEEADGVLMLHRTRRKDVTAKEVSAVLKNERPISDIVAPDRMALYVAKHRRRGRALHHTAFLHVRPNGRLENCAPEWRQDELKPIAENPSHAREREPGEDDSDPSLPF